MLGTDVQGVDIFSQLVYGGQVAFEVGISVTVIGIAIGGTLGVVAAYFGGWVDAVISRVLDILIAFPALVLALVIAEGLGPSEMHVIWALSVFGIPAVGRVARGATLTIRGLPFMTAARLAGTRRWRIIARHVVPNIMPSIVTFSLLGIGIVIILEGALDFLGYGIPQPKPSWGNMIANGQQILSVQPEYVLIPSIALLITVAALNMLGDALRERWGVAMTDALLQVDDLRVTFAVGGREVRAVDGISFTVSPGATLAIIGESGSGKTVSCRAIMGLLPTGTAIGGSARLRGTELLGLSDAELRRHRGSDLAMVFQDPARSLNPTMRIGLQITEAITTHRKVSKREAQTQAIELLRLVRMPAAERRFHEYPHQLSGGMRQRVMIAMALACRPSC